MPSIDDRSSTAKALSKVSEILALCLLMVVPALIGSWIDRQFSTVLLFTLLGLALGMTGAVMQLMKLVAPKSNIQSQENLTVDHEEDGSNEYEK